MNEAQLKAIQSFMEIVERQNAETKARLMVIENTVSKLIDECPDSVKIRAALAEVWGEQLAGKQLQSQPVFAAAIRTTLKTFEVSLPI